MRNHRVNNESLDEDEKPIYDLSIEQNVLGNLLSEDAKETIPKIVKVFDKLGKEVFYSSIHQAIYKVVIELYEQGKAICPETLAPRLKKTSKEDIHTVYLVELLGHDVGMQAAQNLAGDLRDLAVRRKFKNIALSVTQQTSGDEETERLIERTQEQLTELRKVLAKDIKVTTAKELIETPLPENQYLIGQGLIPKQGYTMLVGKAKEGKTMLALQIALCLATATPFLMRKGRNVGLFPVPEAKKTLFLLRENVDETIQAFLKKQIAGLEYRLDKNIKESLNLISFARPKTTYLDVRAEGLRELRNLLDERSPDLVVVDPLSRFLTSDMNRMEAVIKVANTLDSLGEEFDCAFLLLHHFRKFGKEDTETEDIFERITGSSGWRNSYVSCLALERKHKRRSGNIKKLSLEFRTHPPMSPVTIEREQSLLSEQITEEEASEGGSSVKALVEIIRVEFKKGVRYGVIADLASEQFGVSKRRITALLKDGIEQGLIGKEKGKEGKYYALSQGTLL